MRAAVVGAPGASPEYGTFPDPAPDGGSEVVAVAASALTNVARARASGAHYSSGTAYPFVPGVDGIGRTADGRRVAFLFPDAPFGGMAERTLVRSAFCIPVPDSLDDVTAAALINPGVSPVASLRERAALRPGETVLVNGATGVTGLMAVQVAKRLGAGRVVAAGRSAAALDRAVALGADATVQLSDDEDAVRRRFVDVLGEADGVDVVLDYLSGRPAELLLAAIGSGPRGSGELRYVLTGGAAGSEIAVLNRVLASTPLTILGNGIGSVPIPRIVACVAEVFRLADAAPLAIGIAEMPLRDVARAWSDDSGRDRVVFRI